MAKNSKIEWTDATWSPWRGCTKVSLGCKNCYAERRANRIGEDFNKIIRSKTTFNDPLRWKKPMRIFVGHLSDFFNPDVPENWRDEAWNIMLKANHHTYLILTKRIENFRNYMPVWWGDYPWKHIWLGVSVENQEMADRRIPQLLEIPAVVRFVSAEPLLGPIEFIDNPWWDLRYTYDFFYPAGFVQKPIDWIITGGESGPAARPCDLDWVRDIRDQCQRARISFFHKQHGGNKKIDESWGGRKLDGRTWEQIPNVETFSQSET